MNCAPFFLIFFSPFLSRLIDAALAKYFCQLDGVAAKTGIKDS